MPKQLDDPVLEAFAASTVLVSLATCLLLLAARSRGPLLQFQPRRLVPWNAAGALLAFALVMFVFLAALAGRTAHEHNTKESAKPSATALEKESRENNADVVILLTGESVQSVILVGGTLVCIAVYFKATRGDLGLPANLREFANDLFIGIVAGVAAIAPIGLIQRILVYLWDMPDAESGHPLVKVIMGGERDVGVMLLASLMAVVIAPICEEITFRLLLQGWLEKWEAEKISLCDVEVLPDRPPTDSVQLPDVMQMTNDECRMTNGEDPHAIHSSFVIRHSSLDSPPRCGLAGLPFSWLPITISSLLFGLAHFGYGPEPVPLFCLALVLGYVYYRTHRIVPCIVAHALFNLFSMVVLWRMVFNGAD